MLENEKDGEIFEFWAFDCINSYMASKLSTYYLLLYLSYLWLKMYPQENQREEKKEGQRRWRWRRKGEDIYIFPLCLNSLSPLLILSLVHFAASLLPFASNLTINWHPQNKKNKKWKNEDEDWRWKLHVFVWRPIAQVGTHISFYKFKLICNFMAKWW